jgi:hypothetical protein
MSLSERRARAELRRGRVTLAKTVLQRVEHDSNPIAGAEAIALVTRLSRESWSLTRRPFPAYTRQETVYRFVRRRR